MKIILASQSPARKKILADLGFEFVVKPSNFDEVFDLKKSPEKNAMMLAEGKAQDVFVQLSEAEKNETVVIGVDTIIVDPQQKFLEKPRDRQDAQDMMLTRSGQTEKLLSGICLLHKTQKFLASEETLLKWQEMSPQKIQKILDTGEWEGKCGGVAIEGFTGLHIAEISGNYSNVMGFPVNRFLEGMKFLEIPDMIEAL